MPEQMNSHDVVEASRLGIPLTPEMEEILLRDPHSRYYKEHFTHLLNEIVAEIQCQNLAQEFTQHQAALDAFEEQCFLAEQREQTAVARDDDRVTTSDDIKTAALPPTTVDLPLLNAFKTLLVEFSGTQTELRDMAAFQDQLRRHWHATQTRAAEQLVQQFEQAAVLLPNGKRLATSLALQLPANSPEAIALRDRLAAAPMLPDLLNQADNTALRALFNQQVEKRQQALQTTLATDPTIAADMAREQAVKDLKLDVRQLQNKFLLSVSAIYNFLKNQGGTVVQDLVNTYNAALGIDINNDPQHKHVGIYKIIEHSIAPMLTPKLKMVQRRRANLDEMNPAELEQLALKGDMQAQRFQQQQMARLSTMRSLIASLRLMADSQPGYGFLHDICNQLMSQPQAKMTPFNTRLVPKGYK